MGAATAGAPGEAWAYKVLPLDVPPPADTSGRDAFAAAAERRLVAGAARVRARERRRLGLDDRRNSARRSGAALSRDAAESPVGADHATRRRAARGGGSTRPSGKQMVVLARDPGRALSDAARTARGHAAGRGRRRRPGRGGTRRSRRQRGGGRRRGRERRPHTEAFFGVLGRTQDTAVATGTGRNGRASRSSCRKATKARSRSSRSTAARRRTCGCSVRQARRAGSGSCCSSAVEKAGEAKWQPVELGSALFAASATPAQGVSGVAPLSGQAQPLTGAIRACGSTATCRRQAAAVTGTTSRSITTSRRARSRPAGVTRTAPVAKRSAPIPRRALRPAGRISQLRLRRPRLRLADHHQPIAARGRRFDQHGRLPKPGRHDLPAAVRRRRGQCPRGRLLQPRRRLAGRPGADHRHGCAPAPGELAGVGARSVHRGGAGAGHRAGRPGRAGAGGGRRWRGRPLHPRAGLAARVPADASGAVSSPTLRAVAWPEPNRAYAVGDLGAMWLWRAETGLWEKDPAAPPTGFQGDLDGIASTRRTQRSATRWGRAARCSDTTRPGRREELPQGFRKRTSPRWRSPARRRWSSPAATCSSTAARAGRSNPKSTHCSRACRTRHS